MIPLDVRNAEFMLARAAKVAPAAAVDELTRASTRWLFEPKWDGVRALAVIENGTVRLRGRGGHDITRRFPEIAHALAASFGRAEVVLDGELLCFDAHGLPQFALVHRRDMQSKQNTISTLAAQCPATMVVFDVLYDSGDFRSLPYAQRAEHVQGMPADRNWPIRYLQATVSSPDGRGLWEQVERYNLEGLVAKAAHSRYRAGRTGGDWIKIKAKKTASVLVTGLDGSDARTFASLHMAAWNGDDLVPVGRVGSGFSAAELRAVAAHIASGQPLVIEVEYLCMTGGVLREPVFKCVRELPPDDCDISQFYDEV